MILQTIQRRAVSIVLIDNSSSNIFLILLSLEISSKLSGSIWPL